MWHDFCRGVHKFRTIRSTKKAASSNMQRVHVRVNSAFVRDVMCDGHKLTQRMLTPITERAFDQFPHIPAMIYYRQKFI